MNKMLAGYLWKFAIPYMDDIIVFSQSIEEHFEHLRLVFEKLRDNHMSIKKSKCDFLCQYVTYIGYIVSNKGIHTSPDKIEKVTKYPRPSNLKEVRGFLGLTNFYRRFIANYAEIAAPMTGLLKKDADFIWDFSCELAFERLKLKLTTAPVLG